MALYSDLVLKLKATLAADGGSVLIEDVTGTYPESQGGYAPSGEGTLQRPSEDEVSKFLMYQAMPFGPDNQNIPSVATPPPHTFGLVGPDGNPSPDNIYQWIFMVTSIDGDTWDAILTNAYLTDDPWGYITQYFSDPDSGNPVQIGQLAVWANVSEVNCSNEAREAAMNVFVVEGGCDCDSERMEVINFWLQTITSNLELAQSYPIGTQTSNDFYEEAYLEMNVLKEICAQNPSC